MTEIPQIVLTGGPSGGKSTLQRALATHMPEVHCVHEAATLLLSGGFPTPSEEFPWTPEWQSDFQGAVAATQISMEGIARRRARQRQAAAIVYDRGLVDGAAYLPTRLRGLEKLTGLTETAMLKRYDLVLHLPSSAARGHYDKYSNPHRFEEATEALKLERAILDVWQNHPLRKTVDAPKKSTRIQQALSIIADFIAEN